MNNGGGDVAVNDKEPVEEDLNELLLTDSRSSTDSVEMEFQSSRSCRNRPFFFPLDYFYTLDKLFNEY